MIKQGFHAAKEMLTMPNDEEDPKIYDCEVRGPNGDVQVVRVSTGSFEWSNSDGPIAFYAEGKPLQAGIPIELQGQAYTLSRILAEAEPFVDRDFADYEKPDGQRG